jgi:thiamine pyrophosphokinase
MLTNKNNRYSNISVIATILVFLAVTMGFMIKLPSIFGRYDKVMHFIFYFYTSFFINLLYAKNRLINYLMAIIFLTSFGFFIEYFQEYSNHFFNKKIHGRFDIQDIKYNLLGIFLFTTIWVFNYIFIILFRNRKA